MAEINNTKIKICGLTCPEDIQYVNEVKPDYVGFVFWPGSKRAVDIARAIELKQNLNPDIRTVGVFVNEEPDIVIELLNHNIIDIAQLHGDESEAQIREIRLRTGKPVIRAIRIKTKEDVLAQIEKFQTEAEYLLIDSGMGSGETFDWDILKEIHETENSEIESFRTGNSETENIQTEKSFATRNSKPGNGEIKNPEKSDFRKGKFRIKKQIFLAGGLSPDNVLTAIEIVHPYAVDVSSGVETNGKKDREKIEKIVRRVRNEQR